MTFCIYTKIRKRTHRFLSDFQRNKKRLASRTPKCLTHVQENSAMIKVERESKVMAKTIRIAARATMGAVCALLCSLWGSVSAQTLPVAGFTPGSFAVSATGAVTYSIPIQVPPGTAGMEPKLALAYDSQAGNGLVGAGWSLSGLSSVHRCGLTIVQDGFNSGVGYSPTQYDGYCLDGQRLVLVSGVYGADGAEYRTERESFTRVVC
jgi:hypothetical protein